MFFPLPKAPALGLILASLFLAACQNMPEAYAPPEQRQSFENFRPYRVSQIIDMSDGDAAPHIVSGITDVGTPSWRWAGQKPTVRVVMRSSENLVYTIDFSIAGVTFKETGPVTVSFYVNDHLLDAVHYTSEGTQHFEKKIPDGWVVANQPTIVAASIDKVWTSQDGSTLGFILTRMGLRQE